MYSLLGIKKLNLMQYNYLQMYPHF